MTRFLAQREPMAEVYSTKHFHDCGKLLFAFVMFFTYLGISQFIITYQGNLPEEVVWYKERFHGGWGYVAAGLLVFHFFFPFLLLLSRSVKQNTRALAMIAAFVLFMRWVDLIWQSRAEPRPRGLRAALARRRRAARGRRPLARGLRARSSGPDPAADQRPVPQGGPRP